MIESRPDWCVSRQRYWGVPITLFLHKETGELHPNTSALIEQVAQRIQQSGIQAWFDLDPADLLDNEAANYDKVTDVLDVWFDSGSTWHHVLEQTEGLPYPADMYLEGSDQHRGWFHSSILTSVAVNRHAPYRQVLTHGFTVDKDGRKMSKSLGNVIAPQKLLKTLGADIVRLWVCSADYRGEMTVSNEILDRMADAYRRIRNTARYLLSAMTPIGESAIPLAICLAPSTTSTHKPIALQPLTCWQSIDGPWQRHLKHSRPFSRPMRPTSFTVCINASTISAPSTCRASISTSSRIASTQCQAIAWLADQLRVPCT